MKIKIYKDFTKDQFGKVLVILSNGVWLWKDIWKKGHIGKCESIKFTYVERYSGHCSFCHTGRMITIIRNLIDARVCDYCPLETTIMGVCKWYNDHNTFSFVGAPLNKIIRKFYAHKIYKAHIKLYDAYAKFYKKKYNL